MAKDFLNAVDALDKFSLDETKKLAIETFSALVQVSPVDTGRFRANWNLDIYPVKTTTDSTAMPSQPLNIQYSNKFYITNNMPYAQRLNEGHAGQKTKYFVQSQVKRVANQ